MKVSSCVALVVLFLGVLHVAADVSPGQPLFLSQYLPNNYQKAQTLSLVQGVGNFSSYSGYFTVNQTTGSNMFFWYFPAQNGNAKAPVLLWLQGGPGSSSMYGLFTENGPFKVDGDGNLYANPYTWNQNFSMIYIDNPVGAGWSFTTSVNGYASNEDEVAEDLYQAVAQFFQLFPNLKGNDFYVTGESYGGKYVPSLGYKIYQMNNNPKNQFINLKGISVGDGMMDPLTQTQGYADLMYEFSMVDQNQRLQGLQYEQLTQEYIVQSKWQEAFDVFDRYLNGDFFPYPTFYENVTGQTNYFNFLAPVYPPNPYQVYLQKNSTRAAIHTGTLAYNDYNTTVESYLTLDWMQSIRYKLVALLDNYKVLIYNGQNDIILAAPIAENFLRTLTWSGQNQYLNSQRQIWKLKPDDYQVAGYVRKANKFTQVVIRDAGHLAPLDQPQRCLQMIENYVFDLPFPSPNSLRARP